MTRGHTSPAWTANLEVRDLYRNIHFEQPDGIAVVTVDRPEVRNAVSLETMAELREVFAAVKADPEARALILTGAGTKAFISGGELKEFQSLTTSEQARSMTSLRKTSWRSSPAWRFRPSLR